LPRATTICFPFFSGASIGVLLSSSPQLPRRLHPLLPLSFHNSLVSSSLQLLHCLTLFFLDVSTTVLLPSSMELLHHPTLFFSGASTTVLVPSSLQLLHPFLLPSSLELLQQFYSVLSWSFYTVFSPSSLGFPQQSYY
jgi:hypothetical protein